MSAQETRERILDTAERLFAEEGFSSTSLRAITAEAEVNLAAVHYHFGGKDELIQAVLTRRLAPLHQERMRLLDQYEHEAAPEPPSVERILDALLRPSLRLSQESRQGFSVFLRLLGRVHAEPGNQFQQIYCEQFSTVMSRFTAALQRVLPELDRAELFWRMHFALGTMGTVLCDKGKLALLSGGLCQSTDAETSLARMIPFLAAGFRAPSLQATEVSVS